jgi:GntR family transcriptional regulator of arabinose operon
MKDLLRFKNDVVFETIKQRIESGQYAVGMKFPPEPAFAKEFNVGKVTLRSALERLEREKLIVRMRSKGTFVANNSRSNINKIAIITDYMTQPGSPNPYLLSLLLKEMDTRKIKVEQVERFYIDHLPQRVIKKLFSEKQIDGIILLSSFFTGQEAIVGKLQQLGLPVVLPHASGGDSMRTGFASVFIDERRAFADTIKYVTSLDFDRMVIVGRKSQGEKRLIRGYSELELRGILGATLQEIIYFDYDMGKIAEWVDKMVSTKTQMPDIFVCYSDIYAIFLMMALKSHGFNIPRDISVVGFSGLTSSFKIVEKLSGIKFPYEKLATEAVNLIVTHHEWFNGEYSSGAPVVSCGYGFLSGNTIKSALKAENA